MKKNVNLNKYMDLARRQQQKSVKDSRHQNKSYSSSMVRVHNFCDNLNVNQKKNSKPSLEGESTKIVTLLKSKIRQEKDNNEMKTEYEFEKRQDEDDTKTISGLKSDMGQKRKNHTIKEQKFEMRNKNANGKINSKKEELEKETEDHNPTTSTVQKHQKRREEASPNKIAIQELKKNLGERKKFENRQVGNSKLITVAVSNNRQEEKITKTTVQNSKIKQEEENRQIVTKQDFEKEKSPKIVTEQDFEKIQEEQNTNRLTVLEFKNLQKDTNTKSFKLLKSKRRREEKNKQIITVKELQIGHNEKNTQMITEQEFEKNQEEENTKIITAEESEIRQDEENMKMITEEFETRLEEEREETEIIRVPTFKKEQNIKSYKFKLKKSKVRQKKENTTRINVPKPKKRPKEENSEQFTVQQSKNRQETEHIKIITAPFTSVINNVKIMLSKLDNIQELLQNNHYNRHYQLIEKDNDDNQLPLMPIENVETLLMFENNLNTNEALSNKFIRHINLIGGTNYKKGTRNVMASIMTDNVCSQVTWIGLLGKLRMSNTKITNLVVEVITRNYGCEKFNVQETIKYWLRRFSDRTRTRQKSMEKYAEIRRQKIAV